MDLSNDDIQQVVRLLTHLQNKHLQRRVCTAASPMPLAEKNDYYWIHPDAIIKEPFFNLVLCECPHCKLTFTCQPPDAP